MKKKLILIFWIGSQTLWAQKIQVNGVIYHVDPMQNHPIHSSKIAAKDRTITPLIMKKPIRL
jgi:hypothetical protein